MSMVAYVIGCNPMTNKIVWSGITSNFKLEWSSLTIKTSTLLLQDYQNKGAVDDIIAIIPVEGFGNIKPDTRVKKQDKNPALYYGIVTAIGDDKSSVTVADIRKLADVQYVKEPYSSSGKTPFNFFADMYNRWTKYTPMKVSAISGQSYIGKTFEYPKPKGMETASLLSALIEGTSYYQIMMVPYADTIGKTSSRPSSYAPYQVVQATFVSTEDIGTLVLDDSKQIQNADIYERPALDGNPDGLWICKANYDDKDNYTGVSISERYMDKYSIVKNTANDPNIITPIAMDVYTYSDHESQAENKPAKNESTSEQTAADGKVTKTSQTDNTVYNADGSSTRTVVKTSGDSGSTGGSGTKQGEWVQMSKAFDIYYTADDAKNKRNKVGSYGAGKYYVFKVYNGICNLSSVTNSPGGWVNPGDVSASGSASVATSSNTTVTTTSKDGNNVTETVTDINEKGERTVTVTTTIKTSSIDKTAKTKTITTTKTVKKTDKDGKVENTKTVDKSVEYYYESSEATFDEDEVTKDRLKIPTYSHEITFEISKWHPMVDKVTKIGNTLNCMYKNKIYKSIITSVSINSSDDFISIACGNVTSELSTLLNPKEGDTNNYSSGGSGGYSGSGYGGGLDIMYCNEADIDTILVKYFQQK